VDDDWSAVGSSNIDPLSLALTLEANVILRDAAFATDPRERLGQLIANECTEVRLSANTGWSPWQRLRRTLVCHFLRHFPSRARSGYLGRQLCRLRYRTGWPRAN
jgi:cardiolipin synthase